MAVETFVLHQNVLGRCGFFCVARNVFLCGVINVSAGNVISRYGKNMCRKERFLCDGYNIYLAGKRLSRYGKFCGADNVLLCGG